MIIRTEEEMLNLGRTLAKNITPPAVFELIGDVGTGKTTFTRGLAEGLGVEEAVTSPSFTISKRYAFTLRGAPDGAASGSSGPSGAQLIHYDFYRLPDPGIMRDELAEALSEDNAVIVVEWGGDVADLLPESKIRLTLSLNPDGTRTVEGVNL